jgi:hypothetical protein
LDPRAFANLDPKAECVEKIDIDFNGRGDRI